MDAKHSVSRNRDRELLEKELQDDEYEVLLRRLRRNNPFWERFENWTDVIAFMRAGTSNDPDKDLVLRPIFQAHQADGDKRWRTVLLVIFWPGLESIRMQKRNWDTDPNELWGNIIWVFLEVLCRIDLGKRDYRLVQKIFNDTVHHLHDEYHRKWKMGCEFPTDPAQVEYLAGGVDGIDFASMELRETQEAEIRRLKQHFDEGHISEADFYLLVGTRVYGKSVADYARDTGLSYEAAKKRRQRAEASLRYIEKKRR